jgi:hypothetical protein
MSEAVKSASETKKEALEQFVRRKETQIRILNSNLIYAREIKQLADLYLERGVY